MYSRCCYVRTFLTSIGFSQKNVRKKKYWIRVVYLAVLKVVACLFRYMMKVRVKYTSMGPTRNTKSVQSLQSYSENISCYVGYHVALTAEHDFFVQFINRPPDKEKVATRTASSSRASGCHLCSCACDLAKTAFDSRLRSYFKFVCRDMHEFYSYSTYTNEYKARFSVQI